MTPGTALASCTSSCSGSPSRSLGPLRRAIPPIGMIDISPIVFFLLVQFVVLPLVC